MTNLKLRGLQRGKQSGFTIIELIVVILLLGILTATALPRFLDVTDEAHTAVVEGVQGGLNTGVALFRAAYVASGQPTSNVSTFGDGTLDPNVAGRGYPAGDDGGNVIQTQADCLAIFNGVLQSGRPSATAAAFSATPATLETNIENVSTTDFVITTSDAVDPSAGCNFYYTGQFKSGTSTTTVNLPLITYTVATGAVELGTPFTLQED